MRWGEDLLQRQDVKRHPKGVRSKMICRVPGGNALRLDVFNKSVGAVPFAQIQLPPSRSPERPKEKPVFHFRSFDPTTQRPYRAKPRIGGCSVRHHAPTESTAHMNCHRVSVKVTSSTRSLRILASCSSSYCIWSATAGSAAYAKMSWIRFRNSSRKSRRSRIDLRLAS